MGHNRGRSLWRDNIRGHGASFRLPYTFDPSGLPNGALPSPWGSSTFSVFGGVVINTPVLGPELLTDPGLEGSYTGGLCDALAETGSATYSQSADVHSGSKAQEFVPVANNDQIYWKALLTPVAHAWYKFTVWGKRTAGVQGKNRPNLAQGSGVPFADSFSDFITDGSYVQKTLVKRAANANQWRPAFTRNLTATPDETILGDDGSFKAITASNLFVALNARQGNVIAKIQIGTCARGECIGVITRANAISNPSTFLIAYYYYYGGATGTNWYCVLDKCVSGVYTQLIATWTNSPNPGSGLVPTNTQWLEIRCIGTTVQMFQNNSQVGVDQVVADVPTTNPYVGLFSTGGGSTIKSFFVQAN